MRFFLALSLFCCFAPLFGQSNAENRIYLDAEQITIHENQILVLIDNQWQSAEALFSDANGVYMLGRAWYEPWDCGFCGATNPPHRFVCWNCGR